MRILWAVNVLLKTFSPLDVRERLRHLWRMTILSEDPLGEDTKIPTVALWLGLSGVLPFVLGVLLIAFDGFGRIDPHLSKTILLAYGAVILSFLGGARWGLALRDPSVGNLGMILAFSTVPPLVGWVALLPPMIYGLPLLVIGFLVQGLWDIKAMQAGAGPAWYGSLRRILSIIVTSILAATWIGLYLI